METKVTSSHCGRTTDPIFHRKRNSSLEGLEVCDRHAVFSCSQRLGVQSWRGALGSQISEEELQLRAQRADGID